MGLTWFLGSEKKFLGNCYGLGRKQECYQLQRENLIMCVCVLRGGRIVIEEKRDDFSHNLSKSLNKKRTAW